MTEAQQTAAEMYRDARDWLQLLIAAESRALVCTASDGSERAFVGNEVRALGIHNKYYAELPNPPAHPKGHVVTETAVLNAVKRCQPDVKLVDEAEVRDDGE